MPFKANAGISPSSCTCLSAQDVLCACSLLRAAFRPPVTNRMTAVDDSDWWMFSYKVGLPMDEMGCAYSRQ